jgi:hypothetical protein
MSARTRHALPTGAACKVSILTAFPARGGTEKLP